MDSSKADADSQLAHQVGELHFRQFADNSDDVFWLADMLAERLVYVNSRFEHFWGMPVQALMNDPKLWNRGVHATDVHQLPTPFFALDPEQGNEVREYRVRGADGKYHWMRDRRFELRDAQGRVVRMGGITEDVTERKQREIDQAELLRREQAARSDAEALALARDQFLTVVTHELRSPLNAMRGWAHVLRRSGPLTAAQEKALDAIERNTRVQARMVDDLLDSQRILCDNLQLTLGLASLSALVDEAVETVEATAQAKRIHIRVTQEDAIGKVMIDVDRMRQVLCNLLSNAVKFTQEDGLIEVRLLQRDDVLAIEVQDNGIGIDPQQQPHLFNRFQQADRSNTRRQSGLGLGLSLAQQLVELHGGRLHAHSDGVGHGSTFSIELPRSVMPSEPALESPEPARGSETGLAGKRIVIVEDDDDARQILELVLRDAQVELHSFDRAAPAYDFLTHAPPESQPDAVISDIAMPDEDGYTFISRLRAFERRVKRPRVTALALTAFARSEDQARARDAGFDVHMSKPIDSRKVLHTLEDALKAG